MNDQTYRTLVRGRLKQLSSLAVGGSAPGLGGPDIVCARDGRGRLTIPGTALAGCLIETAGRIFPDVFRPGDDRGWCGRMTSKTTEGVAARVLQSLWRFWPAHRAGDWSELRQGVGIRRATGATAAEGQALFDLETLPPGEEWNLFLEIDTQRCPAVEAVALYALREWAEGRCWLGAGPARGLGWMQLEGFEVLRLPCTDDAIAAWPDNRRPVRDLWPVLAALEGTRRLLQGEIPLSIPTETHSLPPDRFGYVIVKGHIVAGEKNGYGLDALSVGGHAAGLLQPLDAPLALPLGATPESYRSGYAPDAPVVTSGPSPDAQRPFVPGSGLRGPLRHAAARWQGPSADPNVDGPQDRGKTDEDTKNDPVARLFGLTSRSSRLLVCDAHDGRGRILAGVPAAPRRG